MDLNQKLKALKEELNQREAEKVAAHNRIIMLRRLIKSTESLIKDAESIFAVEDATEELIKKMSDNGAHSFTESANSK